MTLEEANSLLPDVRAILQRLREFQTVVEELDKKKAVEEITWLRSDGTISPQADQAIALLDKSMNNAIQNFEKTLEELNDLGAQLKDLDQGLVDFFTMRDDSIVYLCWREGEDSIEYWHDLESGVSGRKPL